MQEQQTSQIQSNQHITKMRKRYPEYNTLDDISLAKIVNKKDYPNMDEEVFLNKVFKETPIQKIVEVESETINPHIAKMREKYPMYEEWDDITLARAVNKKNYPDMDEEVFLTKAGLGEVLKQENKVFQEKLPSIEKTVGELNDISAGSNSNFYDYGASIVKAVGKVGGYMGFDKFERKSKVLQSKINKHSADEKKKVTNEGIYEVSRMAGDPVNFTPAGIFTKGTKVARVAKSVAGGAVVGASTMVAKNYGNDTLTQEEKDLEISIGAGFVATINGVIAGVTKGRVTSAIKDVSDIEVIKTNPEKFNLSEEEAKVITDAHEFLKQNKPQKASDNLGFEKKDEDVAAPTTKVDETVIPEQKQEEILTPQKLSEVDEALDQDMQGWNKTAEDILGESPNLENKVRENKTLESHPRIQTVKTMSDTDWDEANALFSKGIDNLAVGTYAGIETDENGNIVDFNADDFVIGLGGYTALKMALKNGTVQGKLKEYAQSAINKIDMNPAVYKENGINAMSPVKSKSQKEKRGIYNVTFNGKNSTEVRKADGEVIEYSKGDLKYGAEHIKYRHIGDDKNGKSKNGIITENELLELGDVIKKGSIETKDNKNIYTYFNENGERFSAIVGKNSEGESVISYYSNRKGGSHNAQPKTSSNENTKSMERALVDNQSDEVHSFQSASDGSPRITYDQTLNNGNIIPQEPKKTKSVQIQSQGAGLILGVTEDEDGNMDYDWKMGLAGAVGGSAVAYGAMRGIAKIKIPLKVQKLFNKGELQSSSSLPDETRVQLKQRQFQDKFNRVKQLINLKADINKIDDVINPYQAEELMHGKVDEQIDEFNENIYSPIVEKISQGKFSIDEVDKYLWARHAPERNAQMLKNRLSELKPSMSMEEVGEIFTKYKDADIKEVLSQTKKMGDQAIHFVPQENIDEFLKAVEAKKVHDKIAEITKSDSALSGMSDDDAYKVIGKYMNNKEMQSIVDDIYAMNASRLEKIYKDGLESEEFIKKIDVYDNYVPLRREFDKESMPNTGKGFDIKGTEIKRAKGSNREVESPFMHSVLAYQETIVRAEKNEVGKAFLAFADEFSDETLYTISNLKHIPQHNKHGAVVSVNPDYKIGENVLHVKIDGKIKEIEIHDKALATAFKNLNSEQMGLILTASHKAVRFLAGLSTSYNPVFVVSNFIRDIQTAMINLPDGIKGNRLNIVKDVFPAMRGIYRNVRGKEKNEWGILYDELRKEGGTTGWNNMYDVVDMRKSTQDILDKYNGKIAPKRWFKNILGFVEDINDAVENSSRLVAYKMAKESGMTNAKSASISKNLTVNFNRKGEEGTGMNAVFMFYNASIQGTGRIIERLTTSKTSQALVSAMVGIGVTLDMWNRSQNADAYAQIPNYIKDTNYIFMHEDGSYNSLKLPYGYNLFKASGDLASQLYHGEIDRDKLPSRFLSLVVSAFSPLGVDSEDPIKTVTPTLAKPVLEVALNSNFFRGTIQPEDNPFEPQKPDSQKYFKSVNPIAKTVAQKMNEYSGGNMYESGWVDVSPESIEHLVEFATGGLGKLILRTGTVIDQALDDDKKVDMNKVPFLRAVYATPREKSETNLIYKMHNESGKTYFNKVQRARFFRWAKEALNKGDIKKETYKKLRKKFTDNQSRIDFARKHNLQSIDDYSNSEYIQDDAKTGLHRSQRIKINKELKKMEDN